MLPYPRKFPKAKIMSSHDRCGTGAQKHPHSMQIRGVGFSQILCRFILFILGIKVILPSGELNKSNLICCNHVSWLDILILHAMTGCGFVAKKEIQSWPLVGFLAKRTGAIFVDRSHLGGRVRCVKELQKRTNSRKVCIFPEGTTRRGLVPLKQDWKQGWVWSARGQSVELVALAFSQHTRMGWDDGESLMKNFRRVLSTPNKICLIKTHTLEIPLIADKLGLRSLAEQSLHEICQMLLISHGDLKNAHNSGPY